MNVYDGQWLIDVLFVLPLLDDVINMINWLNPSHDLPDWQDMGRRVEVKREDGSVTQGKLCYEDVTPGPDEHPLVLVEINGDRISIFDFIAFRYFVELGG